MPWKQEDDKTLHPDSPGAVFGSGLEPGKGNSSVLAVQSEILEQQTPKEESIIRHCAKNSRARPVPSAQLCAPCVEGLLRGSKSVAGSCLSIHAEDIV